MTENEFDPVSRPEHYSRGSLECIDWIRLALTEEEYRGYLKGCILKYHWRHEDKGNPVQDLEKLRQYAQFLIDEIEREEIDRDILEENERCAEWVEKRRTNQRMRDEQFDRWVKKRYKGASLGDKED